MPSPDTVTMVDMVMDTAMDTTAMDTVMAMATTVELFT